jgi:hypothetical protein
MLRSKAELSSNFTNMHQITSKLSMLSCSVTLTHVLFMVTLRRAFEKIYILRNTAELTSNFTDIHQMIS